MELSPTELVVRLTDRGEAFDPSTAESSTEPMRERGYGLTIIRALVTEVRYRRSDGANHLELRMEIGNVDDAR